MLSWVQTWEQTHNRQDRPAFEYQTRLFVWNLLETFFCSQLYGWRLAGLSKIVKITNATVKILDNIIKGDGVCTISATNHIGHMKRPYRPHRITILATGKMYCYLASTFKSYLFESQNIICNPVSHKQRVRLVKQTVLKQVITSLIMSHIDYCNSLLINLPTSTTVPLRVQNDVAWLVLGLDCRAHITPALKQLHWLPVPYRLQFKIATLIHQIYHRHCPQYLVNLVSFTSDAAGQCLRSTATKVAVSVRTRTNLGRRAFLVAGPSVWNSLPSSLRLIDSHK